MKPQRENNRTDHDDVDEVELARAARTGTRAALARWLHHVLPTAAALLLSRDGRLGRDGQLDDLLQETALKAVRGIDRLKQPEHARTWICRIALNVLAESKRQGNRAKALSMDQTNLAEQLPVPPADASTSQLDAAIARLEEPLRQCIVLKYTTGLSYDEMARMLEVSRSTVKARLHRARKTLRTLLENRQDG